MYNYRFIADKLFHAIYDSFSKPIYEEEHTTEHFYRDNQCENRFIFNDGSILILTSYNGGHAFKIQVGEEQQ